MELKDFVKDTLVQVATGIREANLSLNDALKPKLDTWFFTMPNPRAGKETSTVDFDVAVTVSETDAKAGGGGIKVYALQAGGEKRHEAASERVSRISFTVTAHETIGQTKYGG